MSINMTANAYTGDWETFEVPLSAKEASNISAVNTHIVGTMTNGSDLGLMPLFNIVQHVRGEMEVFGNCIEKLYEAVNMLS
ncbi:uncharacterized protein PHACADRAFT_193954 [Phanerochaete carnosa HHB-10118-sp]|uniref:Uncharacterized protein n=1 Tax=Phanerochaete carnosa (strain HHB-10118-sp) TaxID=650164 RepID=K5VXQ4_PHACS|nr:uncharacterized protein PHACADRAFT_193954 [Phanerochaete carnosa HHB-10118-sp]EKM56338.1 hypothetical protein PHACADRAFT_193954 [Phanerochaete carnosa HHB-10118-sp]